jgi:hypothetical protein
MDYFVLTTKSGGYFRINSIVRCKDSKGDDVLQATCSGKAFMIEMRNVAGIFPTTVSLGSVVS